MMGPVTGIVLSAAAALFAVLAVSVALSGYLLTPLHWIKIGLFFAAGILLITPQPMLLGIGFGFFLLSAGWEFFESRSKKGRVHGSVPEIKR
jgi:TRAP-type uncharacterized transport system fused permease subunit